MRPVYSKYNEEKFVNPYSFVRLPKKERTQIENQAEDKKVYSGKLKCKIITKTPLAILDIEKMQKNKEKHSYYPFYSINEEYVIPASSIRGCLRSMYETLTDSCFVTMPDNEYLMSRVDARNCYAPGILKKEDNRWKLYKAERFRINIKNDYRSGISKDKKFAGERVLIDKVENEFYFGECVKVDVKGKENMKKVSHMEKSDSSNNYVFIGEPFSKKKCESVFKNLKEGVEVQEKVLFSAIKRLKYIVNIYRDKGINKNLGETPEKHMGYRGFERAEQCGVIPIWYKLSSNKNKLYLSMAAVGRHVYENTVNDLVGEQRNPCKKRETACPACSLFGMSKKEAFGSHVRITDAKVDHIDLEKKVTLQELSFPKSGYLPFYSEGGKDYDIESSNINGRKYYWHNPKACVSKVYTDEKKNQRNTSVDLAKVGSTFSFELFFDKISKEQLNELKWVISLGENSKESTMCHKIGHGKPLGLGSVKILIEEEWLREFSEEKGYEIKKCKNINIEKNIVSFNENIKKEIMIISDFNAMKNSKISYPYVIPDPGNKVQLKPNDEASYQWFLQNKKDSKPMLLKNVKEKQQALSVYKVKK